MPFGHSRKRIAAEIGVLVVALGVLAFGLIAGGRWVARRAVAALPTSVDRQIGAVASAAYDRTLRVCTDDATVAAVNALVGRLQAAAGGDLGRIETRVALDEQVNAFALPGGHVYVLSGLLGKLESADELAGVLAHELGHVSLRHHVRNLARTAGLGITLALVFGDVDGVTQALVGGADRLTALAFSREQEAEADAYGATVAARAGFDPRALGRFFARLEGPALPALLQDHPPSDERRAALGALARGLTVAPAQGPSVPLDVLARGCRP